MPEYPDDWDSRRKQAYRRDNFACQRCGKQGGPFGDAELHAHHQLPKSMGGSDDLENTETLCKSCHEMEHGYSIGSTKSSESEEVDVNGVRILYLFFGLILLMYSFSLARHIFPAAPDMGIIVLASGSFIFVGLAYLGIQIRRIIRILLREGL